jgi:hypothetical protein
MTFLIPISATPNTPHSTFLFIFEFFSSSLG